MALRNIRIQGDPILTKECRKIDKMTPKIKQLIQDMFDTMYDAYGVGLAAPQVGILKQLVVIDTTGEDPHVLINPEIIETSGEQTGEEGCLSVPGKWGIVTRPNYVKVRAFNQDMEPVELEGKELLARAFCHEIDSWVIGVADHKGRFQYHKVQKPGDQADEYGADAVGDGQNRAVLQPSSVPAFLTSLPLSPHHPTPPVPDLPPPDKLPPGPLHPPALFCRCMGRQAPPPHPSS